jgi:primosomal protein N''
MSIAEIIMAIFTTLATAITAWAAVHKANQLTAFRLDRLEHKVDSHNNFDRRLAVLEEAMKHVGGEGK